MSIGKVLVLAVMLFGANWVDSYSNNKLQLYTKLRRLQYRVIALEKQLMDKGCNQLLSSQILLAQKAITHLTKLLISCKTSVKVCDIQADITFILDNSGSVGSGNFKKQLTFMDGLIKDFDVAPNKIRIGVVKFASHAKNEFYLNTHSNKAAVLSAVKNIKYEGGGTNTAGALKLVRTHAFTAARGDRPGVPNIVIIITDGGSNNKQATLNEAAAVRKAGTIIYSIGIGSGIKTDELKGMATDPDKNHVFTVANFDALKNIKSRLAKQACSVPKPKPQTPICPRHFVKAFNHCYYLGKDRKNWYEARRVCQSYGGDLIWIESQKEDQFMLKMINDYGRTTYGGYVWIGATDVGRSRGQFYWVHNNKALRNGYTNWYPGEPHNYYGHDHLCTINGRAWGDWTAYKKLNYFCKV